jgi:hypothetical protein
VHRHDNNESTPKTFSIQMSTTQKNKPSVSSWCTDSESSGHVISRNRSALSELPSVRKANAIQVQTLSRVVRLIAHLGFQHCRVIMSHGALEKHNQLHKPN